MKLSDIIVADAIVPELKARTRDEVIRELIEALASAGAIAKKNVDDYAKAVLAREKQATTGIGKGVALPHAKIKGIKQAVGTIGRSSQGIDFWKSRDSTPFRTPVVWNISFQTTEMASVTRTTGTK